MRHLYEEENHLSHESAHDRKRDKKYDEKQKQVMHVLDISKETRNLSHLNIKRIDLQNRFLVGIKIVNSRLIEAIFSESNLENSEIHITDLSYSKFRKTNLQNATFHDTCLHSADLSRANLNGAVIENCNLSGANLSRSQLKGATLCGTNLAGANLSNADLTEANLDGANLMNARLIRTNLKGANLSNSKIFGIAAWKVQLDGSNQHNLIITPDSEPMISVDSLEVAQFIYIILQNNKIPTVIDAITSKLVLILGNFKPTRKSILDFLRVELRIYGYVPILLDCDEPKSKDMIETVTLLASLARFIIADITDPSSIPMELERIIPNTSIPIQPLCQSNSKSYSMFSTYKKYNWVLNCYYYEKQEDLRATLFEKVISPAESMALVLDQQRQGHRGDFDSMGNFN